MKNTKLVLGTVFSLLILVFLLTKINLGEAVDILTGMKPAYLIGGFLGYLTMNLARCWRYQALIDKDISFLSMLSVVFIHNFYNNTLPARTGEISFPVLMKNQDYDVLSSVSVLLTSRILDLISILILFLVSLLFITELPSQLMTLRNIFVIATALGLVILFLTLKQSERILPYLEGRKYLNKAAKMLEKYKAELKKLSLKRVVTASFHSLVIWAASFLMYHFLTAGVNQPLYWPFIVIAGTFVVFSTLLPIQGFLQLGTVEGAWAAGLVILGINAEKAIYTGIVTHFGRILFFLILGLVGYLMYLKWTRD